MRRILTALAIVVVMPILGCGNSPETTKPEQELQDEQLKAKQKVGVDEREMRKKHQQ
jgi:hypothetical protein